MPIATINDRRVLFIHIPKTGGTSVTRWMQSHARTRLHSDQRPVGLSVSPQHLTFADIETMWGSDDFDYSFTVVRNPFSRMESEFRMRNQLRGKGFFGGQLSFPSWLERSLRDAQANPNHMDNHLRPQWHFLSDKLRIFRFEDGIDQILTQISADLGLPTPDRVPHTLATATTDDMVVWDRADVLRMREHYALDFETLGYAPGPVGREQSTPAVPVSPPERPNEPVAAASTASTAVLTDSDLRSDLVRKYVSLGDNCEFGFVQRHYGCEDGGLLRWAITFPDVLAANIRNSFEGIFEFENLSPYSDKMVSDKASGIKFHSAMLSREGQFIASEAERRDIHAVEMKKLDHLRSKLTAALSDPASVFVYKHNHGITDEKAEDLAAAVRTHGGARLLVVRDGAAPSISHAGENLYLARLPQFSKYAEASAPDIASWTELLTMADPLLFADAAKADQRPT
ncbi:sulfotransferase family 2 domain-containing protein [Paracoccus pacificus]|uniref:Sulfotransferase family 2 domain-containing protein n=1 Tax=Paracoccus pacificus TaxID=1463598 RepID=A0ABW4R6C1_9RHOB